MDKIALIWSLCFQILSRAKNVHRITLDIPEMDPKKTKLPQSYGWIVRHIHKFLGGEIGAKLPPMYSLEVK